MLKVNNLKKNYGSFQLDCSLQVKEGMITGFLGRNGSGKTTTIKAILGLIFPDQGEIEFLGRPINQLTGHDKEKLGVVLSDSSFSRVMNCKDVLAILKRSYRNFDEPMFRHFVDQQGLTWDKKFENFSTGMQAKLKVITAISHKAQFLIMDEPTSGLDVVAREEILDLLREYLDEYPQTSILISSHIATDLEGICDDFYLIDRGKIIMYEEMDQLLSSYGILKFRQEELDQIDQTHIIKIDQTNYGYCCLTNQRQFYLENYPQVIIEKASVDDLIKLMVGGQK
ncbi:ABC transporter ATP-binding protein [Facklamia miroungae]|uniref:ABC-2 type transport system ATP-binding protein n=1 Tax=Facklamia miroungae TaxID=120956 RepID=A0A1G7U110_9LACT|nr:ABC transporter ATP-binding protein [Facklamia miroungae]NKZ29859.1 ABC transporter ATP-binding protein [Facklamia miroungae]SDG41098.1 ABC-2 type transport system ATP-binding protein [Facklamia miroungae]